MKNQKKIVLLALILSGLISCSGSISENYAQTRSTLYLNEVSEGLDYLIELSQLRRAYLSLDLNYKNYREETKLIIEGLKDNLKIEKLSTEFWQKEATKTEPFYKNVWFGFGMGVIITGLIITVSK